jgi:secreted PhoX family phosphatase
MKMHKKSLLKIIIILVLNGPLFIFGQSLISDFVSIIPQSQGSKFRLPNTHTFQAIIMKGDPLTGGGVLGAKADFTGYVPINGSSSNGYLSVNAETTPGAVSILDINYNNTSQLWGISASQHVDFSPVVTTAQNCSGTVTPWNTIVSCEETTSNIDENFDGYADVGWCVEIDPGSKQVIDKLWALGHFRHENITVHSNRRTVYEGADSNPGYLYKFVADVAEDLSAGQLFVYKGEKTGSGQWIKLKNTTKNERNTVESQSISVNATIFNAIEDVEVGPNGWVYFAVKNERQVYRFKDSDSLYGMIVHEMETYVGNQSYSINDGEINYTVDWGAGNDNLTLDREGNLYVMQGGDRKYIWFIEVGHNQNSPKVKLFCQSPLGGQCTGMTFSPDEKFMFMSIQNPNASNNVSIQFDAAGKAITFDRDVVMVVARNEHLGLATNISNKKSQTTNIFPNPVMDNVTISGISLENQLKISTILGEIMSVDIDYKKEDAVINMRNCSRGLYLISWTTSDGINRTQKIVKQ